MSKTHENWEDSYTYKGWNIFPSRGIAYKFYRGKIHQIEAPTELEIEERINSLIE